MPAPYWIPRVRRIEDDILSERARLETILERESRTPEASIEAPVMPRPTWTPLDVQPVAEPEPTPFIPAPMMEEPQQRIPMRVVPQAKKPPLAKPAPEKVEEVSVPFWKRALGAFAAPFNWVDENLIKPGMGAVGTGIGFVEEVPREPGEDFWEWKKRSWAGWESPGIDINVPWSDDDLRLDVRGVMELAPWLLIPGAGQVGGGLRAARGVAGALGKLGKVGKVVGYGVEYSPWGIAEKTAGVALKAGFKGIGKASEMVSTAVGEKLFGKYVPPPTPESVVKLTTFFKEAVMPARKAFKKEVPFLRTTQEKKVQDVLSAYRSGKFPMGELQSRLKMARSGGISQEFALTQEALLARQTKLIANIKDRISSGDISESVGKALITKARKSPQFKALEVIGETTIDDVLSGPKRVTPEVAAKPMYHGTDVAFEKFSASKARPALYGKGIYFTDSKQIASSYGKNVKSVYLDIKNPFVVKKVYSTDEITGFLKRFQEVSGISDDTLKFSHPRLYNFKMKPERIDGDTLYDLLAEGDNDWLNGILKGMGYDGINHTGGLLSGGKLHDVLVAFNEKQITFTPPKAPVALGGRTITRTEVKELNDMILSGAEYGLVKADSADAFLELVLSGKLPQPHNIRDWSKVFGVDFARAVGKMGNLSQDKVAQFLDTLNIGRSLQASIDLSATLRQGLILSLLHPTQTPKWFGRQIKALISEKWSLEIDDAMRANPRFREITGVTGAYIAPIRDASLNAAEELFASRTARRIPGIRRSERAFVTYINQARWSALESGYNTMLAQGATAEQFKLLGKFVDIASGRGVIPKSMEKYSSVLNAMLFSPKLQAATIQLPRQIGRMLLSKNPYMRKEAAKALLTFFGGGASIVGLLQESGVAKKVELDPRSGDFGKIVIGDTRLDIWRGYLQYIRLAAQMLTGERKSAYGNMNEAKRSEVASRFLQSKGSPAFGLMVDLLRNETYMGEPIFDDTTGFIKAAKGRILPLAFQDIMDAMEQNGINGLWVTAPAELGIGALTYVNDLVKIQQKIARDAGYNTWDEIDPKTQRKIQNNNAELQTAYLAYDRRVMGTAWGDWSNAGKSIESVFEDNVGMATAQYRENGDGYTFREKVGKAFDARRGGYDARDKETRFEDIVRRLETQDPAKSMVELGPEQMAIRAYNEALWGDDMYDEFGDYRFDEAEIRKQQLREQLSPEMFEYVEEYRGLKYENFPPEYQELARAKTVLRPYWQIKTQVEDIFGKRFAESPAGQRLIAKLKKAKRIQNPEMEKYYQMFYVRE